MAGYLDRSEKTKFEAIGAWFKQVVGGAEPEVRKYVLQSQGAKSVQDTMLGIKPATDGHNGDGEIIFDTIANLPARPSDENETEKLAVITVNKSELKPYPREIKSTGGDYGDDMQLLVNPGLIHHIALSNPGVFPDWTEPPSSTKELELRINAALKRDFHTAYGLLMGFDRQAVDWHKTASPGSNNGIRVNVGGLYYSAKTKNTAHLGLYAEKRAATKIAQIVANLKRRRLPEGKDPANRAPLTDLKRRFVYGR